MTDRDRIASWLADHNSPAMARQISATLGLNHKVVCESLTIMSSDGRARRCGTLTLTLASGRVMQVTAWGPGTRRVPPPVVREYRPGPLVAPWTREPHPLHAAWWPRVGWDAGVQA